MLRAALIGTGRVAEEHLRCLAGLDGVEVVAVCDRSPAIAEVAAERHGVPRWYTDHRELLDAEHPDVVHITTPPSLHVPMGLDALEAGAHVVVEKPAAPSPEELERLLAAAEERGRVVVENLSYLCSEAGRRIRADVARGALGDVLHVDVTLVSGITLPGGTFTDAFVPHYTRELSAGAIGDFLPHMASVACALTGPHVRVESHWASLDAAVRADEMRALVVGRQATAALTFSAHARPEGFWLRVYGSRGQAAGNLFEPGVAVRGADAFGPLLPTVNGLAESRAFAASAVRSLTSRLAGRPASHMALHGLVTDVYTALLGGGPQPVSPDTMRDVSRLMAGLTAELVAA